VPFLLRITTQSHGFNPLKFSWKEAVSLWQYAWPLAIGNIAYWGLRLSDRYIISFFRSPDEVGLYSVAYNISDRSIDMLVALFILSIGPLIANTWEVHGREATESALKMATRVYLIICLPAALGLTLVAVPFVRVFTSPAYFNGYEIVGYVAMSSFFWGLSQIASRGLLLQKNTRRFGLNLILSGLLNLVLNVIFVPQFGFIVAGITTLIGYVSLFLLQVQSSNKNFTWHFPIRTLVNVLLACATMVVATLLICGSPFIITQGSFLYLLKAVAVSVSVYIIVLFLLLEVSSKERTFIKQLVLKILSKVPIRNIR
jgi:O-antigen/teichoic acid export membrane protein